MQAPQVAPVTPASRFFASKFQPATTFQKPAAVTTSSTTTINNNVVFPTLQRQHAQPTQAIEFDGKRLRKAVTRKTVDYNSSVVKYLEARIWQRDYRDRRAMQPDPAYYTDIMPPLSMPDNPINAVTTKFVRTSTNKMRCPIFCVAWTPEGRRLVTGASSGEFTLWNGLTFNFETILQAHDSPVRCMVWSHNDVWMVTGDHAGYVKYWQSNMNNVKMFQAHKEPLRAISFCPVDTKFVTCSDDGTVRIWDFLKCFEEKILRGHGADVKCVDWHPQKSLIVSGSKDSQQPIKLWDPKSGQSLATIHAHKNTVMDTKWNRNGNWLLTASRDHLIKLFDIRNMKEEMQTFRGHKKEATTLAWHPIHEGLFTSGGSDGCVMFWVVGADKEVGCMEQAHDSCVWSLAWHPLGHILCSGSNDHSSKFWTRNRPGDRMRDKYNLNTLPKGQEDAADYDDSTTISAAIPGMGLEHGLPDHLKSQENSFETEVLSIPGLDFTSEETPTEKSATQKKTPFSKPIPKQFQQQWMESKQPLLLAPPVDHFVVNTNGLELKKSRHESEIPVNTKPASTKPANTKPELVPPPPPPPPPASLLIQTAETHFQTNSRDSNQLPDQKQLPPPVPPPPLPPFPPRAALLGERPMEQNQGPNMSSNQEMHMGNMLPKNMSYPEERNFPVNYRPEERDHEWRTYSECPERDVPADNEMHSENGAFINNPNAQHNYEPNNNVGPPNRARPDMYPPNPLRDEDEFMPDVPPRGRPLHFNDEMFPSGGDMDLRINNKGMGPEEMEMGFMPHKRSWNDGPPNREDQYPPMDYDEPPQKFPPRPHGRSNQMFHSSRGSRKNYRGRSPYRVVNRGRDRGRYLK